MKELFPDSKRGLSQTRGGEECADVENCGPFWIECKVGQRPNIYAAMVQSVNAIQASKAEKVPVVITHKDRGYTTVTMMFDDWFDMLKTMKETMDEQDKDK